MPSGRVLGDGVPVDPGDALGHHRVVEPVAEQVHRHQRVHPGRLDAAPAAVLLLPGDDPLGAAAQCGPPNRLYRSVKERGVAAEGPVDSVQGRVEAVEEAGPGVRGAGGAAYRPRVEVAERAGSPAVGAAGLELVDGDPDGPRGAERLDHGQRHDRLPRPAAPVVDVEREPGRQVDQFRRDDRQVVPRPQAGQGQPDPGEHAGRLDAAVLGDPVPGQLHVRRVRLVAGQPQGQVGLYRGGQVGGPAVEVGPGAVVSLLGPDPAARGRHHGVVVQAEELAQQQVLGVHGHVGLELALPPPLGVLQAEQVVASPVKGPAGEIRR